MPKHFAKILLVIITLFNFIGYAQNDSSITIDQLKNKIKNDSNFVLLDVRNPAELSGSLGHLDGVINIPVQELEPRISELDKYKSEEIVVICRTGHRSNIAAKLLRKNNFKAVSVNGGMTAYRESEK
jgi:rhodanese-related sulfurtransferase